ncbi:MAG: hypothetical protein ACWA41_12505 [Putridiphycobacter sp.]
MKYIIFFLFLNAFGAFCQFPLIKHVDIKANSKVKSIEISKSEGYFEGNAFITKNDTVPIEQLRLNRKGQTLKWVAYHDFPEVAMDSVIKYKRGKIHKIYFNNRFVVPPAETSTLTYDQANNTTIKTAIKLKDGEIRTETSARIKDTLVCTIVVNNEVVKFEKTIFNKNQLVTSFESYKPDSTLINKINYTYNTANQLTKATMSNAKHKIAEIRLSYNAQGFIADYFYEDLEEQSTEHSSFTYDIDEKGNWTKKYVKSVSISNKTDLSFSYDFVVLRSIKYYRF